MEEALDIQGHHEQCLGACLPCQGIVPQLIGGKPQPNHGRGRQGAGVDFWIGAADQIIEQFPRKIQQVEIQQEALKGALQGAVESGQAGRGGADLTVQKGLQGFPGQMQQGRIGMGEEDLRDCCRRAVRRGQKLRRGRKTGRADFAGTGDRTRLHHQRLAGVG